MLHEDTQGRAEPQQHLSRLERVQLTNSQKMRRKKLHDSEAGQSEDGIENEDRMRPRASLRMLHVKRYLIFVLVLLLPVLLWERRAIETELKLFFQALRFKPCDMTKEQVSLPPVYVLNGRPLSQFQDVYNKNSKFIEMIVVGPSKEQTHNLTSHTLTFTCAPCSGFSDAWLTTIYANLFAFMLEKYARNEFSSLRSSFPSSFELSSLRSSFLTHLQ
jgi:hypothetical protein